MEDKLPIGNYRREYFNAFREIGDLTEKRVIGKSVLGEGLCCYKIGRGKRGVVAVGAHHAMEHITASALYRFVDFLTEELARGRVFYGVNLTLLLQKFTFWIIPCLNPDGVDLHLASSTDNPLGERQIKMNGGEDFSRWQSNARGVDLNHNYDYGFYEYKGVEAVRGIYPGRGLFSGEFPESEPETRAMAGFVRALAPSLVVSLHTQGEEIYFAPADKRVGRIAARLAASLRYSSASPSGTALYGGLCDYTGYTLGIPSFTVELGRGENPLPMSELPHLAEVVRKALITLPTLL